jgi:hypothetical protein
VTIANQAAAAAARTDGGSLVHTWVWIVVGVAIGLAAAAVLAAIVAGSRRARSRRKLRREFGPEYDRTVADAPTRREAESELLERKQRRDLLEIRALSPGARQRYARDWRSVQARFVDDPGAAAAEADRLVQQLMAERGYPVSDFDERTDLVSVDHPTVVENYREAHRISLAHERGGTDTEDLRRALVHYRALFADLLETDDEADDVTDGAARIQEVH